MYDKEMIRKVCDLTCSKEEVVRNQTTIKYDTEHPFKTYYNVSTVTGAITKYISKEWDDQTLAHWACIYCWILSGGFDDNVKEDLDTFEGFFRDAVTWDLDGLSFFSAEDNDLQDMHECIKLFERYNHIWQTRKQWRAVYAMIGPFAEENGDQYVALINDTTKEYMIIYSDHLENGFQDEHFKFVTQEEHILLIEQLKNSGYQILSCSEEYYYSEILDQ